jgi:CheY-like chemotaxis protein
MHEEKRRARVLHVESNKYVFRTIKAVMSLYKFAAFHNVHRPGLSAAAAVLRSNRHFDIIITDHDPPELDCGELINLVRSLNHREDTPVLVLASVLGGGRPAAAKEAEAFISKPPDFKQLERTIERLLSMTFPHKHD